MYTLEVIGQTGLSPFHPLTARPTVVGRAPDCDIVLAHPSISRRHAVLWVSAGEVRLEDLRCHFGTWIDGERVHGEAMVQPGQTIYLGQHKALRIKARTAADVAPPTLLAIEDMRTGYRCLLGPDPLYIGRGPECALRLEEGPERLAVVVRQGDDEAWLGVDDDMHELEVDVPFLIANRELVLRAVSPSPQDTVSEEHTPWPYRVQASLNAPGGPIASILDETRDLQVDVTAENRAILLYLLARQWSQDARARVAHKDRGWMDDEEVAVGVWGREGRLRQLKVLVCRVRQELREGGLDPWVVEKRRGALRMRISDARVDGPEAPVQV